jgi:mono/diheme cytochrome c family protein
MTIIPTSQYTVSLFTTIIFLVLPMAAQDEPDLSKMSGTEIYNSFCSRCHGVDGKGNIPEDMIAGMEAPPPDLTEGYFSSREKRSDWEAVVKHGGAVRGLSMSMPAWGSVLTDKQVTEVVEHMKTFVDQSLYPQGETNFFRAHRVTKAFVEQEALLIPTFTTSENTSEFSTTLYYANRFGTRFQYEAKLPIVLSTTSFASHWGLGDMELGVKYCIFDDYRDKQIFSVGLEAGIPTGNKTLGFGGDEVGMTAFLAGGMQFGSVLQAQGSLKLEGPVPAYFDELEIKSAVAVIALFSDSKQGFFPGIEVEHVYQRLPSSSTVIVIPKLYWGITAKGHLAVSFGPELQVSGRSRYDTRWRAFFLWDYVDGGLWW